VLVVGQPTAIDPTRPPAGRHVLWIQVRVLPFEVCGDAAGEIEPGDWDAIKDRYAECVLDLLERHAPGIRASVLGRSVLSPLDLQRDNPNLVGGDSLAGSHHLDQFFGFRTALGQSRWRTRVDGLYLVGASTWPGAGTGAGSGYMLAPRSGGTLTAAAMGRHVGAASAGRVARTWFFATPGVAASFSQSCRFSGSLSDCCAPLGARPSGSHSRAIRGFDRSWHSARQGSIHSTVSALASATRNNKEAGA
jgi:hypothetical protein